MYALALALALATGVLWWHPLASAREALARRLAGVCGSAEAAPGAGVDATPDANETRSADPGGSAPGVGAGRRAGVERFFTRSFMRSTRWFLSVFWRDEGEGVVRE